MRNSRVRPWRLLRPYRWGLRLCLGRRWLGPSPTFRRLEVREGPRLFCIQPRKLAARWPAGRARKHTMVGEKIAPLRTGSRFPVAFCLSCYWPSLSLGTESALLRTQTSPALDWRHTYSANSVLTLYLDVHDGTTRK